MNFVKMINDMTTLMTDMLRKINIKNMMMKSHNHNNFLMTALFMKMNMLIDTIAEFVNIYYTSSNDLYNSYDFVDNIIVVAASMINDDICEVIKKDIKKAFSEIFSDTFSDSFCILFLLFASHFQMLFYIHQSFF